MSTLRTVREAAGLTREQLALRAETSTSTVARMELNGRLPNAATLLRIATVLDTTVDSLLAPSAADDVAERAS